ncbi:MAG TPA: pyridoxamine 5'-phosphate oxidase family protein [Kofleriaceae bacterium]|jgi:general stress protein 26|nr:pyridoxamine 5'-phosphate oxidase family protein [Kofleriaceae bacterium]
MGLSTATIEMESPEAPRERLHELVKAARSVLVLHAGSDDRVVGQPMAVLRTSDDTTLHVAASLAPDQRAALARPARVTVVVPDASCAMFDAEAVVSRDRTLLDELGGEAWKLWGRSKADPSVTVLVISPIEGAYWQGARRHAYQYRVGPAPGTRELSDGVPMEI